MLFTWSFHCHIWYTSCRIRACCALGSFWLKEEITTKEALGLGMSEGFFSVRGISSQKRGEVGYFGALRVGLSCNQRPGDFMFSI
jgi:hypothetical protein